jgi:hypothetical protein
MCVLPLMTHVLSPPPVLPQGCFFLAQQLRRCGVPFRIFELTGHGSSSNKAGHIWRSSERHVKGMSGAQQQAVLHAFKVGRTARQAACALTLLIGSIELATA